MKPLLCIPVIAAFAGSTLSAQSLGEPLPKLDAVKWYNAPALQLEDLRGKAVLLEVFRTW